MPGAKIFLDANVLIYARDASTPAKQAMAAQWLHDINAAGETPIVSWQTLREYYSVVTRKAHLGRARAAARKDVAAYRDWLSPDPHDDLAGAWRIEDAYGFSFYDCLIAASAVKAQATHLLTEDLQHNQLVDGVRIVNPFKVRFADLT